jgi:hypothetical protein
MRGTAALLLPFALPLLVTDIRDLTFLCLVCVRVCDRLPLFRDQWHHGD